MNIEQKLSQKIIEGLKSLYGVEIEKVIFEKTNPDFEGDLTFVVFPYLKASKKKPEDTANEIGTYLKDTLSEVQSFNAVKGFLNIVISDAFWLNYFNSINAKPLIKPAPANAQVVMVEYSSPNTNKPLHLGHVRNNLLGYSVSEILKAAGNKVIKTNLVNDRGIHICKSMLAWQKWGNNETPESSGMKGDHLVGKYYVEFDKRSRQFSTDLLNKIKEAIIPITYNPEYLKHPSIFEFSSEFPIWTVFVDHDVKTDYHKLDDNLKDNSEKWFKDLKNRIKKVLDSDIPEEISTTFRNIETIIDIYYPELPLVQVKEMLRKWEANDKEVRSLWEMMNGWVYKGFDETYKMLGVDFDKIYYESNTYILGKNIIEDGLSKGVLKRRSDNSVFADLTGDGLDEKTLLRGDGTSVYMTQDLGTALERAKEINFDKHIYTVGNEQDYHFKVLFLILKKLGYKWADGLYHLSYGMVELPDGKMKSREGTVVDADELMEEMISTAKKTAEELGKAQDLEAADKEQLYKTVGMGALKYFMLKVDPKKKMLFNPAESIDFNGNTAPFIQFNYVRIRALLRKATELSHNYNESFDLKNVTSLLPKEKELIIKLYNFDSTVKQAAHDYSPALIANYVYDLAKEYSQFYHDTPILKEENKTLLMFRLQLSHTIGIAIKSSMGLLGIEVPERM
ncbi:MAG: arginyl-tRNA synthetase [Bacteroidetes bacterium]|jgi:arginyl-tRNA synthetase|nr:arginyl-tRNA synthetase [Bacteroidota bacterium]